MPHEKAKRVKKRLQKRAEKAEAKERERIERSRRIKRKVKKPIREAKQAGREVKAAGAEAKRIAVAHAPFVSSQTPTKVAKGVSVKRRPSRTEKPSATDVGGGVAAKGSRSSKEADVKAKVRRAKIRKAQQLRNRGLTTKQVGAKVGMSASWVSANTDAVPASQTPEAGDDLEQASDTLLGSIQSVEEEMFGFDEDGDGILEGGVDIDLGDIEADLDIGGDIDAMFEDID